jgi:hypothetical protein
VTALRREEEHHRGDFEDEGRFDGREARSEKIILTRGTMMAFGRLN